ncbi:MAG: T9SS type A sorting domain-containing protein [Ignavibacteriales bacterium]|nr:T9SS type A sorting domain-containing protein [Ignavibacteriales bacterium]
MILLILIYFSADPNYVLVGESHNWAQLKDKHNWTNYSFACKIKLIEGGLHLNFRVSNQSRYYIPFNAGQVALKKDFSTGENYNLADHTENFMLDNWHEIKIMGMNDNIKIYVNNELKIDYTDLAPIKSGNIAFEVNPNAKVFIDSVVVMGEPLPEPPPGYIWERTGGPNGGIGYDIRIHPLDKNIMFVTDNPSGVNKSYDGGKTWIQKNDGIPVDQNRYGNGAPIFSLTIDSGNPNIVWAGTQSWKGIYKSTDLGETWEEKVNGITEGNEISFRGFAIHPQNSNIVLAAGDIFENRIPRPGFELVEGKIYKTIDGGDNWYPVWKGDNCARVLIFDYNNPDIVYCSTGIFDKTANNVDFDTNDPGGEGILKSNDRGETWHNINNGIDNLYLGFLEMHPLNSKILYAAAGGVINQDPFFIKGGVYKTIDGGENWINLLETDQSLTVITISNSNPEIIYTGGGNSFYRSNDGGISWMHLEDNQNRYPWGPPGIWGGVPISAVVDPDNPNIIFVNSYQGGNYKSADGAKTWINASRGYSGADLRDISIDPYNPEKVYTVGRSGPFKSIDGGSAWIGLKYGEANNAGDWHCIAINPKNTNELLMSDETQGFILKSINYGLNWDIVFEHPESGDLENKHGFKKIEYSPSNPEIIYAGMRKIYSGGHIDPLPEPSYGIFKSEDGGFTWTEKNNGLTESQMAINDIAVHPTNSEILYVGTYHDGVYKSTDGGDNWFRQSTGLGFSDVRSLAIDPKNPETIYAGSGNGNGLCKTTNGGKMWFEINDGIVIECPSYLSPIGNTKLGINLDQPKNYFNTNYNFNYIPWTKILDIVIDPTNIEKIYAADLGLGIYLSEDAGESWWPIIDGLSVKSVTCLTISADGTILYAGTSGAGVHRLVLGKNKAPSITSTIPSRTDTISVTKGDSLNFEVFAFDFNNDTLKYSWHLDGRKVESENTSKYLLKTSNLSIGTHNLFANIAERDTSVSVQWDIKILYPTLIENREQNKIPCSFSLQQNYPNPFNPHTTIKYQLPKTAKVVLKIFNMLGQEVKTLINDHKEAGYYIIQWDGRNMSDSQVASGIYICRVEFHIGNEKFVQERKMLLLQ